MAIEANVRISLSWEDLRGLSTEQCDAVMRGIAACVSADPRILEDDKRESEQPER